MQSNVFTRWNRYFAAWFYRNFFPKNAEERLLIDGNKISVDRFPEGVFGLKDILEAWILLQACPFLCSSSSTRCT